MSVFIHYRYLISVAGQARELVCVYVLEYRQLCKMAIILTGIYGGVLSITYLGSILLNNNSTILVYVGTPYMFYADLITGVGSCTMIVGSYLPVALMMDYSVLAYIFSPTRLSLIY